MHCNLSIITLGLNYLINIMFRIATVKRRQGMVGEIQEHSDRNLSPIWVISDCSLTTRWGSESHSAPMIFFTRYLLKGLDWEIRVYCEPILLPTNNSPCYFAAYLHKLSHTPSHPFFSKVIPDYGALQTNIAVANLLALSMFELCQGNDLSVFSNLA